MVFIYRTLTADALQKDKRLLDLAALYAEVYNGPPWFEQWTLESTLKESRLQLTVSYENLPKEIIPQFKKLSEKESYTLLAMLDKWLAEYDRETNPDVEGTGHYRAGIGIYYFEEDLSEKIIADLPALDDSDEE